MVALALIVITLVWTAWLIYAHYVAAHHTAGAVRYTMWIAVILGVLGLALTAVALVLPESAWKKAADFGAADKAA